MSTTLMEWDEPIEIEQHYRAFFLKNRAGLFLIVLITIVVPLAFALTYSGDYALMPFYSWIGVALAMSLLCSILFWHGWILPRRWNKEPSPKHIAITEDGVSITNDRLNLQYEWSYLSSFCFIQHPKVPTFSALELRIFFGKRPILCGLSSSVDVKQLEAILKEKLRHVPNRSLSTRPTEITLLLNDHSRNGCNLVAQ